MAQGGAAEMTRDEFFDACRSFDWYYEMSDDHRVWLAGSRRMRELQADAQGDKVKLSIMDAWRNYKFSGEPWGTKRPPMPRPEDFNLGASSTYLEE